MFCWKIMIFVFIFFKMQMKGYLKAFVSQKHLRRYSEILWIMETLVTILLTLIFQSFHPASTSCLKTLPDLSFWMNVVSWCSGYHLLHNFIQQSQILRMFKSYLRLSGDSRWCETLIVVPAGNKAWRLLSVNHTAKTNHHHYHYHHIEQSKSKVRANRAIEQSKENKVPFSNAWGIARFV